MPRTRADVLLLKKGLVESRTQAQRLIMAGQVRINGQLVLKPSSVVPSDGNVEIKEKPKFVSRGGFKLESAIQSFGLDIRGMICADVGASTGGFTDCLLHYGAKRVYAIDVGQGILHWKLRNDPRVFVMEGKNARYIDSLPEPIDLVTIDVSFISLKIILPVVKQWLSSSGGQVLALIKPQFEAGKDEVDRGKGVIRDREVHQRVLLELLNFIQGEEYSILGLIPSSILGPKGNVEFFIWLEYPGQPVCNLQYIIEEALIQSEQMVKKFMV